MLFTTVHVVASASEKTIVAYMFNVYDHRLLTAALTYSHPVSPDGDGEGRFAAAAVSTSAANKRTAAGPSDPMMIVDLLGDNDDDIESDPMVDLDGIEQVDHHDDDDDDDDKEEDRLPEMCAVNGMRRLLLCPIRTHTHMALTCLRCH